MHNPLSRRKGDVMAMQTPPQEGEGFVFLHSVAGQHHEIPDWFMAWLRLGAVTAGGSLESAQRQTVIAVSVPTRLQGAASIALGYVRQRYTQHKRESLAVGWSISLSEITAGAKVWVRIPKRVIVGDYLTGLPDRLYLSTPKTGAFQTRLVKEVRTPPPGLLTVGAVTYSDAETTFVKSLLPSEDPEEFLSSWDWSLMLVGSPERIYDDLAEHISMPGGLHFGPMSSIVRPIQLTAPTGWRSSVMSARAETLPWEASPTSPHLVILDRAYATSRWLPECPAPVVIAILERTEPGVDAAVATLMQERAYATSVRDHELGWNAPAGCEVLAFRKAL
ncbi:hypothetical protein ACWEPN_03265 [Nonomuraea wenchangensis]